MHGARRAGRHFLQIPGPSNVPDRVLEAMSRPTIDHRGPAFAELVATILDRLAVVFGTSGPVLIFPSSGSGAWEAALVNTLSPGDRVLALGTGHFARLWADIATRLGLEVDWVENDWRHPFDPEVVRRHLLTDEGGAIKAVQLVHCETSTGILSDVAAIRAAIDAAGHAALLLVDTISSLGATDYRHDEWRVDVTVAGSQKGLMLPPGLGMNAVSDRALVAAEGAALRRSYWDWGAVIDNNAGGFFPYTPATNLLFGLDVALDMLLEEGLENVFARHRRHATATRRAVAAWGLTLNCLDAEACADSLTAVCMPDGHDADAFRRIVLERFDMSLGTGLGKVKGRVFRIGHLGDFNDLMLAGTLSGVEMGLGIADVPHTPGGIAAALEYLARYP